jgi:hypothetical protein
MRLDNSTFLPDQLIGGWNSLIWTERFTDAGDFELLTYDIDNALSIMPIKGPCLLCLRGSDEVMIVDEHEITMDDNGIEMLKTTGRTFETFLEQRFNFTLLPGTEYQQQRNYTDGEMIELLIFDAMLNNSYNVLSNSSVVRTNDQVPNVLLAEEWTDTSTSTTQWMTAGVVYPDIRQRLSALDFGIRNKRPNVASANIVSITNPSTWASRGVISRAVQNNITSLVMELYDGVDRSASQSVVEPVVMAPQLGHFHQPRSLFSLKDFKTAVDVRSPYASGQNWQSIYAAQTGIGLNRRWKYVEVGDEFGTTSSNAPLQQYANQLYLAARKLKYFDGEVTSAIPYVYGVDYNLGDLVTVIGNHDFNQDVRVVEFIRSQDENGETAYPTLAFIDPDA